ncbi:hypothetical protein [Streptomyces acidiscabies]|uniref:Uncharacterized protein n=2 Tax=Streptomyces acidiscabies TaxID=42234 RepID=A0AAP6BJ39_9ACTN|nr:hypothetical protein [Streptomyces acidiscabies]MDX2965633.1 hypothetical protein [Streptomyces acidiscabies]MDX3024865.1 hypothetical protein [Streptomyces acidiscabies]MDX3795549.1 hypothetical protein [Streptomyces acidiscabies]
MPPQPATALPRLRVPHRARTGVADDKTLRLRRNVSLSSDLIRFATALAGQLGWTATPTQPHGHPLWGFGTRLHEALDQASEAALLTTPGGTEFIIAPRTDPDAYRYLVGPLRPTDLPANTTAAIQEREPTVVLLNAAATPEHAADRFSMFLSGWEDHLTRARAALEPVEAARLDDVFTAYAGTVAATLPGDWTATVLDLDSRAHQRLFPTLWATGPDTGRKAFATAARAALLTGPRHRVLLVQDAGPHRDTTAVTFLPARLRITPDSPVPGPAALSLTADAAASAQSIRSLLLPAWDRAVFSARTGVLAHATAELRQAIDSWDAVGDTYHAAHDPGAGAVIRDARAWTAVQTYLTHAPATLNAITAVTTGADRLAGPVSRDLRTLDHLRETLRNAGRLRREWDARIRQAPAAEQPLLVEERNAEMWSHAVDLAATGEAMIGAARHVTGRIGTPPPPPAKAPASLTAPTPPPAPAPVLIIGPTRRGK